MSEISFQWSEKSEFESLAGLIGAEVPVNYITSDISIIE